MYDKTLFIYNQFPTLHLNNILKKKHTKIRLNNNYDSRKNNNTEKVLATEHLNLPSFTLRNKSIVLIMLKKSVAI